MAMAATSLLSSSDFVSCFLGSWDLSNKNRQEFIEIKVRLRARLKCKKHGGDRMKEPQNTTSGGINAASLFLLFSAVFCACLSCFSCHVFADFFFWDMKNSPLSNCSSIWKYHRALHANFPLRWDSKLKKQKMRKKFYYAKSRINKNPTESKV